MFSVFSLLLYLMITCDATLARNVNATVGDSAILHCSLKDKNITDLRNLRFYWQDDGDNVSYSFNKGRKMTEHVNDLYQHRVTAFPEDMIRGNISIIIKNLTLHDNGRIFHAFAAVLDGSKHLKETTKICQIQLHIAVPFKNLRLDMDVERMTAQCKTQEGFPVPVIHWTFLHNNSQHSVNSKDIHTTTVQDSHSGLYSSSSTLHIPEGPYQAVTCLSHNPTLNRTLSATHTLDKAAAVRTSPEGLMAAAVLLTALWFL